MKSFSLRVDERGDVEIYVHKRITVEAWKLWLKLTGAIGFGVWFALKYLSKLF